MRNRMRKLGVLLITSALIHVLGAVDFRSPYVYDGGPLRYVFEPKEANDYGLKMWTTGYTRDAHKAFLSHGTKTKPLTALLFNKDEFRMREIFYNSDVALTTEYYNPFVKILKIKPRATYSENGITFGGQFDYPVYKEKVA